MSTRERLRQKLQMRDMVDARTEHSKANNVELESVPDNAERARHQAEGASRKAAQLLAYRYIEASEPMKNVLSTLLSNDWGHGIVLATALHGSHPKTTLDSVIAFLKANTARLEEYLGNMPEDQLSVLRDQSIKPRNELLLCVLLDHKPDMRFDGVIMNQANMSIEYMNKLTARGAVLQTNLHPPLPTKPALAESPALVDEPKMTSPSTNGKSKMMSPSPLLVAQAVPITESVDTIASSPVAAATLIMDETVVTPRSPSLPTTSVTMEETGATPDSAPFAATSVTMEETALNGRFKHQGCPNPSVVTTETISAGAYDNDKAAASADKEHDTIAVNNTAAAAAKKEPVNPAASNKAAKMAEKEPSNPAASSKAAKMAEKEPSNPAASSKAAKMAEKEPFNPAASNKAVKPAEKEPATIAANNSKVADTAQKAPTNASTTDKATTLAEKVPSTSANQSKNTRHSTKAYVSVLQSVQQAPKHNTNVNNVQSMVQPPAGEKLCMPPVSVREQAKTTAAVPKQAARLPGQYCKVSEKRSNGMKPNVPKHHALPTAPKGNTLLADKGGRGATERCKKQQVPAASTHDNSQAKPVFHKSASAASERKMTYAAVLLKSLSARDMLTPCSVPRHETAVLNSEVVTGMNQEVMKDEKQLGNPSVLGATKGTTTSVSVDKAYSSGTVGAPPIRPRFTGTKFFDMLRALAANA